MIRMGRRRFALLVPLFLGAASACAISPTDDVDQTSSALPQCGPDSTAPICNPTCKPKCAGKVCGAPDGCGDVCASGSCPIGDTCGGTGVVGQCGHQPGDLRFFQTGFRNQGDRDTCTVFAVTAAVEAAYRHRYGLTLDLSEQFLHHAQKSHWLNAAALLPAREIQPETNGGGNVPWQFAVLERWGIPRESTLPYIGSAEYQNLAGWTSPNPTAIDNDQRALDDFMLASSPLTLQTPSTLVTTVLPQAALEDARYRPTSVKAASWSDLLSVAWFKSELLAGREIAFDAVLDGAPPPNGGVWSPGSGATYAHAMLIVGFDDSTQSFWVKNQWGSGRFERFSYSWVTSGKVVSAETILAVADPTTPFRAAQNPHLFLGRWNLDFDGWHGSLDLYRLPGSDHRMGTYWGPDGVPRRANGWISGNRLDLYIDWNNPNASPSSAGGNRFILYAYDAEHGTMAGLMRDTGGNSWTATAQKGQWLGGVPRYPWLSRDSYSGRWELDTDGTKGTLAIDCTSAGQISGTFTTASAVVYPVTGATTADPRVFSFVIQDGSASWPSYSGYLNGHELGIMSGASARSGTSAVGFHAVRFADL